MGQSVRATTEAGLLKAFAYECWLGLAVCSVLASFGLSSGSAVADPSGGLGLPVSCIVGNECFVQQMPDIDPTPGVLDPLCGLATYQGHDGGDMQALVRPSVAVLDYGLADTVPSLPDLLRKGAPPPAKSRELPMVAWVWAINVEAGYRFRIRLVGPDETVLVDHTTNALEKRKASYLAT